MSPTPTDAELLTRFVEHGDQAAFTLVVERHLRWLYPAALRILHDPGRAHDVTQAVFILLAQKAGTMRSDLPLSPWLFRVLQYTIRSLHRSERRRAQHEANAPVAPPASTDAAWLELREVIDMAVTRLAPAERQAILLRFYEDQSLAAVGSALRITEDAAKKRVARALAKLRDHFRTLGVSSATLAIVPGLMPSHLVSTTSGLSASAIATSALGAATAGATHTVLLAKGATTMMTLAKVKFVAVLVAAAGVLVAGALAIQAACASSVPARPPATASAPAAGVGILDFRIAVLPDEISANDLNAAKDSLKTKGSDAAVKANNTTARWFEMHSLLKNTQFNGLFVSSARDDQFYILCYDDHDHSLTHADPLRKPWSLTAGDPQSDPTSGGVYMPFKLDANGGTYMGELTSANIRHPMAMLLDNRILSAPTIQSQITDAGQISFGSPSRKTTTSSPAPENDIDVLKEAQQIIQMINTPKRPANTQPTP